MHYACRVSARHVIVWRHRGAEQLKHVFNLDNHNIIRPTFYFSELFPRVGDTSRYVIFSFYDLTCLNNDKKWLCKAVNNILVFEEETTDFFFEVLEVYDLLNIWLSNLSLQTRPTFKFTLNDKWAINKHNIHLFISVIDRKP